MVINEGNQGDWQKLDPRVADVVQKQEAEMLKNIVGITATHVQQLFSGPTNDATVAGNVIRGLTPKLDGGIAADVERQIQGDLVTELSEVRKQEEALPAGGAAERLQRQTKEFAAAVRRAIPADIFARVHESRDLLKTNHRPTINIGATNRKSKIDLSHSFWLNRIQDRDELIKSLTNVPIGEAGITHPPELPTHPLAPADAAAIADSITPSGKKLWQVLLRHNTKTLLSDEQVSSINVEEATQLVLKNAEVRKAIAPPDTSLKQTEMNELVEEKNIAAAIERLQSVDMPELGGIADWGAVGTKPLGIAGVNDDISNLAAAVNGTPINMDSIGVTGFDVSADPAIRSSQISSFNAQLRDKKRELEEINQKMQRYSSVLASVIEDIRTVEDRKASGSGMEVLAMFPGGIGAGVSPLDTAFTKARTPDVIANQLRTVLTLRSSASEYDADIASRRTAIDNAGDNPDQLTGREAVLKVFDTHNRQVQRLDARRSEEATHTRYARNEMNKEEHDAKDEAVDDLIGRDQRLGEKAGNIGHNIGHGSPQSIICKLAESDAIGASTSGTRRIKWLGGRGRDATPKWSELSYPRLITAYTAMRSLKDNTGSPIHLRNTTYYQNQMRIITNLLTSKHAEQVERDFAREPESEDQRQVRKGQGERNRKQRLVRLLMHNEVPSTYTERANSAIAEAAGRCNRVRRATAATYNWTKDFTVNRAKNVFLGEGSKLNPITYPARTVKGVGKGAWAFLNSEI